jgi:hypothetical protein
MWEEPQAGGERTILTPGWERLWTLGSQDDALLARPMDAVPREGGVVLQDAYDRKVMALTEAGEVEWTFGSMGEGPGEFQVIQAIRVDANGVTHVLDRQSSRITRLAPDGTMLSTVRTPPGVWFSMAVVEDGYILESPDAQIPFQYIPVSDMGAGEGGGPEVISALEGRPFGLPWDGFTELSIVQRQGRVIAGRDDRWAYAFSFGNGWIPFRGFTPLDYLGQSIEHTDFPGLLSGDTEDGTFERMVDRPTNSTASGWISGDTLHIHFGGGTEDNYQIVDRYDWASGDYLDSVRLPDRATTVTRSGDVYYLLRTSPWPTITAWRMVD